MSKSLSDFGISLGHTDRLIAGTKAGAGKPSAQETSMFVASVALAYASWESYIEDVAVEVTKFLAAQVSEAKVPISVQRGIEAQKPSTWELTVHPGWRKLWISGVSAYAKGGRGRSQFGMNTANVKQIGSLYELVGLDAVSAIAEDDRQLLGELVKARGQVVHTAATPEDFNKGVALTYRHLVERMAGDVDTSLSQQAAKLAGQSPW